MSIRSRSKLTKQILLHEPPKSWRKVISLNIRGSISFNIRGSDFIAFNGKIENMEPKVILTQCSCPLRLPRPGIASLCSWSKISCAGSVVLIESLPEAVILIRQSKVVGQHVFADTCVSTRQWYYRDGRPQVLTWIQVFLGWKILYLLQQ